MRALSRVLIVIAVLLSAAWTVMPAEAVTVLLSANELAAPTNLTATRLSWNIVQNNATVQLDWDKGEGVTNTVIVRQEGRYPENRADGALVYNGTSNTTTDTGLSLGTTHYYYRAWSWHLGDYSPGYADADIGGESMLFLCLLALALGLTGIGVYSKQGIFMLTAILPWAGLGVYVEANSADLGDAAGPIAVACFGLAMVVVWFAFIYFMQGRKDTEDSPPEASPSGPAPRGTARDTRTNKRENEDVWRNPKGYTNRLKRRMKSEREQRERGF